MSLYSKTIVKFRIITGAYFCVFVSLCTVGILHPFLQDHSGLVIVIYAVYSFLRLLCRKHYLVRFCIWNVAFWGLDLFYIIGSIGQSFKHSVSVAAGGNPCNFLSTICIEVQPEDSSFQYADAPIQFSILMDLYSSQCFTIVETGCLPIILSCCNGKPFVSTVVLGIASFFRIIGDFFCILRKSRFHLADHVCTRIQIHGNCAVCSCNRCLQVTLGIDDNCTLSIFQQLISSIIGYCIQIWDRSLFCADLELCAAFHGIIPGEIS